MQNKDLFSRILGVLVFVGGVMLLLFVFKTAHELFSSDLVGISFASAKGAQPGAATAALGESAAKLFIRIILLCLMSAVASIIASKGISLYFAATRETVQKVVSEISE